MFLRFLRAEIYRKWVELGNRPASWLLITIAFYTVLVLVQRGFSVGGDASDMALISMSNWLGAIGATAAVSSEVAGARSNATIALRTQPNSSFDFVSNTAASALIEIAFAAMTLPILWLISLAMGGIDVATSLYAFFLGAVVGLCIGPFVWSLSLFMKRPVAISAVLSIVFFFWNAAGINNPETQSMGLLKQTSPFFLAVENAADMTDYMIWVIWWAVILAICTGLSAVVLKLIRKSGDLIID